MTKMRAYFKLDLYFFEHPKVIDLSHPATVLYIASIAYCNRRETDGFVAQSVLRRLIEVDDYSDGPDHKALAAELVRAGLWEEADGGWQVHDFLEHNDSSQEREDRRGADAERKRRARSEAKEHPDGPEPPSGGPSGNVRSDTSGRPIGQNEPSAPIAVTEQSTNRAEQKINTVVDPTTPDRPGTLPTTAAIQEVWDAYLDACQLAGVSRNARLTPKRRDKIRTRLKAFPLQDVVDAAWGWTRDPWPERRHHCDAVQVFKTDEHVEKFRDLWRHGPPHVISKQTAQAMRTSAAMRARAEGVSHDLRRVGRSGGSAERGLPAPAD